MRRNRAPQRDGTIQPSQEELDHLAFEALLAGARSFHSDATGTGEAGACGLASVTDAFALPALHSQAQDLFSLVPGQYDRNVALPSLPGYPGWDRLSNQLLPFGQHGLSGYQQEQHILTQQSVPELDLLSAPFNHPSDLQGLTTVHSDGSSPNWLTSGELSGPQSHELEASRLCPLMHTQSAPATLEVAQEGEAMPVSRPVIQTGILARGQSAPAKSGGRRVMRNAEERKQHRMAKNRATAAASRRRRQAAKAELLAKQKSLQEENADLRRRLARVDAEIAEARDQLTSYAEVTDAHTAAFTILQQDDPSLDMIEWN